MPNYPITPDTKISRGASRGVYDQDTIHHILDEAIDITISYIENGIPKALPTGFVRMGNKLYIHGSIMSHFVQAICKNEKVCLSVSLLDGLVLANTAFSHSFNYRSVVIFSSPYLEEDEAIRIESLRAFTEKLLPGRWDDNIRLPSPEEMKVTAVVCFPIEEASAKVRQGQPNNPKAEEGRPVWTGYVPLKRVYQEAVGSPDVPNQVSLPGYIKEFVEKQAEKAGV